jgi:hypothetical protein
MGAWMMDAMTRADHHLKEATKYFDEAKVAASPFLCAYYQRVAERYLSSQGELKLPEVQGNFIAKQGGLSTTERAGHTLRQ